MLSAFLKKYRQEHGMTQADLAKKLEISQNTVSQYESGKRCPTVKRITGIAAALNCTVNEIVSNLDT